jgi:hypothetical protein
MARRRRCRHEGCSKSAIGNTGHCSGHGEGIRCQHAVGLHRGCTKGAVYGTPYCKGHGGSRRCHYEGCSTSAQGGGTPHCVAHGGGKRCAEEGCSKSIHPGSVYCTLCIKIPRGIPAPSPPAPRPVLRPQPRPTVKTDDDDEPEDDRDECTVCGDRGGFLISCSFCVRSFHFECLDKETLLSLTAEPSGDTSWACPRKVCKVPSLRTQ